MKNKDVLGYLKELQQEENGYDSLEIVGRKKGLFTWKRSILSIGVFVLLAFVISLLWSTVREGGGRKGLFPRHHHLSSMVAEWMHGSKGGETKKQAYVWGPMESSAPIISQREEDMMAFLPIILI